MNIEISNEELLECLSEEIKDYLYEAFSQWVDDAEPAIIDYIYKPIAEKIIEKINFDKKFQESIIDNVVTQVMIGNLKLDEVYFKAEEKAIKTIAKEIVKNTKINR